MAVFLWSSVICTGTQATSEYPVPSDHHPSFSILSSPTCLLLPLTTPTYPMRVPMTSPTPGLLPSKRYVSLCPVPVYGCDLFYGIFSAKSPSSALCAPLLCLKCLICPPEKLSDLLFAPATRPKRLIQHAPSSQVAHVSFSIAIFLGADASFASFYSAICPLVALLIRSK